MTKEDLLKTYLQNEPRARERVNKVRALCNLLQRNHPAIQGIPAEVFTQIIDETIAYERYWRKILLENPDLRGKDYQTKREVVQKFQQSIGYEGGYTQKLHI